MLNSEGEAGRFKKNKFKFRSHRCTIGGRETINIVDNKFYKGYEGEPEIQFIEELEDGTKGIFSVWDGYFNDIMELFQPGAHGWEGLALYYHLDSEWYNESPWKIPDKKSTLNQFQVLEIKKLKYEISQLVLKRICEILSNAIEDSRTVWIALE